MKTSLQLFTDPRLLSHVSHRQVATLVDRLVQLFPGDYMLPSRRTDNLGFIEVLAAKLADPEDLPAPFLKAFEEIEALASPENVRNLNIPQNVDPREPESQPLYHAIAAWLSAHPAPVAAPPRVPKPPKSDAPREGAAPAESHAPAKRAVPANNALPHPVPSLPVNPPSVARLPPESLAPQANATSAESGNGSGAPDTASASLQAQAGPDDDPYSRPGLKLRLSVLFWEIDPRVRHEFFTRFEKELREAFPELPEVSYTDQHFDNAVYGLLTRPAFLPEPMRDALLAIQELAEPRNRQLLRALATWHSVYCEKQATPEHVAVNYWLKYPFRPGELDELRSTVPSHLLAPTPPKPRANGAIADEDDGLPRPDPVSEAERPNSRHPGDLAAIARFPRNKIAKLPPDVREELNVMLRQRVPYDDLLAHLGPRAEGINCSNLSRWKKTGYRVWLAEQERREDARVQIEFLFDLVQEKDNCKLHEAAQQIGALRISQLLASFDATALTAAFQQHPQSFVRLIQTLPSLGRAGMDCERVLVELSEHKAAQDPATKKQRGLSKEAMQYVTSAINLM